MKIVKTQNLNVSIQLGRIVRTTIEKKDENCYIITATIENDRPVTLGRYPCKKDALKAEMDMWLTKTDYYEFPISSIVAPEERIDDRKSKRRGGS